MVKVATMKCCSNTLIVALIIWHQGEAQHQTLLTSLEKYGTEFFRGWPDADIPPLDPLLLESVKTSLGTKNFVVENLSAFKVTADNKGRILLTVPLLSISSTTRHSRSSDDLDISEDILFLVYDYAIIATIEPSSQLGPQASSVKVSSKYNENNIRSYGAPIPTCIEILEKLEKKMFVFVKRSLKITLEEDLPVVDYEDYELDEQNSEMYLSVNDNFDHLFANARRFMVQNEIDPLRLPSDEDTLEATLFNSTIMGNVSAYDGFVKGVSTIHRTGDMTIEFVGSESEIELNGTVGLIDLETAKFTSSPGIVLEECYLTDFGPTRIETEGLPDSGALNLGANALTNIFLETITDVLGDAVCGLLESILQGSEL